MDSELKQLVNPAHSAVIIVDLQNDFCHSEGSFGKGGRDVSLMQKAARNTEKFLQGVHKKGVPVIFIRARHNEWTSSPSWLRKRKNIGAAPCMEGTWGEGFFIVNPREGEPVVVKHRYSAFIGTDLDLILRSRGIKTIILTGVGTNVCVESTARDGFMMDYDVVVLSDCTGSSTLEDHTRSLDVLGRYFATIVTSKEISEAWARRD